MVTKTEKFLYSMLKNADLKTINWDLVSAEHGINTKAARDRWWRIGKLMSLENPLQHQNQPSNQQNPTKGKGKSKLGQVGDDEDPPKPIMKARDFSVKKEWIKEEDFLQDVKGAQAQDAKQHSAIVVVKLEKDRFW